MEEEEEEKQEKDEDNQKCELNENTSEGKCESESESEDDHDEDEDELSDDAKESHEPPKDALAKMNEDDKTKKQNILDKYKNLAGEAPKI